MGEVVSSFLGTNAPKQPQNTRDANVEPSRSGSNVATLQDYQPERQHGG